jgi:hypothetical protein
MENNMQFIPIEIVKENNVSFFVADLGLSITNENWPENLVYNQELKIGDETFYRTYSSDTTLYFDVMEALNVCKSLISRAIHNTSEIWEHGPIMLSEIGGDCPEPWMTRSKVEVVIRKLLDNYCAHEMDAMTLSGIIHSCPGDIYTPFKCKKCGEYYK